MYPGTLVPGITTRAREGGVVIIRVAISCTGMALEFTPSHSRMRAARPPNFQFASIRNSSILLQSDVFFSGGVVVVGGAEARRRETMGGSHKKKDGTLVARVRTSEQRKS